MVGNACTIHTKGISFRMLCVSDFSQLKYCSIVIIDHFVKCAALSSSITLSSVTSALPQRVFLRLTRSVRMMKTIMTPQEMSTLNSGTRLGRY